MSSTISQVALPVDPATEAELDRLAAMPALEALAALDRLEPWWFAQAIVRAAARRAGR